jgi:hypothetical protein
MPFKSDKQRKWMYANDPEMAKKWAKEEAIREKLRRVIRQEIKSVNELKKMTPIQKIEKLKNQMPVFRAIDSFKGK